MINDSSCLKQVNSQRIERVDFKQKRNPLRTTNGLAKSNEGRKQAIRKKEGLEPN